MEVHDHMLNRSRVPADGLHLPLRKLALCLDCDECFELGHATCPACGSATWTTAARFLKLVSEPEVAHRGSSRKVHSRRAAEDLAIAKHLLIVARHRRGLYEQIKRAFAGHETVQIVLDRRVSERRQRKQLAVPDRRGAADRRARSVIDDQLRTIGWSLVLLDLAKTKRR
jgi:RNA polymerase subunit RPABC4/transcription elongation factor Spt4